jgi:hypothetical protein
VTDLSLRFFFEKLNKSLNFGNLKYIEKISPQENIASSTEKISPSMVLKNFENKFIVKNCNYTQIPQEEANVTIPFVISLHSNCYPNFNISFST